MKICAIPLDIAFADVEANIVAAAHRLNGVEPDTDIVVLPELFTTSFIASADECARLAEPSDGPTMRAVKRWAEYFGFAVAGSFLCCDKPGHYVNRAFFVEPSGETTFYVKRHLFPLSTEDKVYTGGTALPPVVRFRGWNISLIVCFDIRFPVWCRNTATKLYDVLLIPSNWPASRAQAFRLLCAARAVENQAYVVGANRTGTDPYGEYPAGISDIYNLLGDSIRETRQNGDIYALLSHGQLDEGRRRFPAFRAADPFDILLD